MQFIFVDFWVTVDFTRSGVNHGHWHFIFGIEVKQANCTFQFNRYFSETSCILRERIDNASVAFKVREYTCMTAALRKKCLHLCLRVAPMIRSVAA